MSHWQVEFSQKASLWELKIRENSRGTWLYKWEDWPNDVRRGLRACHGKGVVYSTLVAGDFIDWVRDMKTAGLLRVSVTNRKRFTVQKNNLLDLYPVPNEGRMEALAEQFESFGSYTHADEIRLLSRYVQRIQRENAELTEQVDSLYREMAYNSYLND